MSQRTHNIYFHLHTVSGIVISIGLYVIFLAGAFTLLVEPIKQWEQTFAEKAVVARETAKIDYNRLIDSLSKQKIDFYGRNLYTSEDKESAAITIYLSGSEDSLASAAAKKPVRLEADPVTYQIKKAGENGFFSMGDLLYNLHFYYQLGDFGYYLSGLVSLFFLFAIVTGIIVHWKKISMNFFVFRPKQKLKTVWTDAHTVLGVIGIPFQFMYALTGAMFGLSILVALAGSLMYDGTTKTYYDKLYDDHVEIKLGKPTALSGFDYNHYREKTATQWAGFEGKYFAVLQMGSTTQQFRSYGYTSIKDSFLNEGEIVFDMKTGKVVHEENPYEKKYEDYVSAPMYRLHYAAFTGLGTWSDYALKMAYFLMALLTCFVIITGVLIWLEARSKLKIPEKEKAFNANVGYSYLAFSLTMFPVIAFSFIVSKLIPADFIEHRKTVLNVVFFVSWLLLSIFFWLKKDNYFTNKFTLLSGAILGLIISLVSGIYAGNWPWHTYAKGHFGVLLIDVLWLGLSALAFFSLWQIEKSHVAKKGKQLTYA
jgi:uncharacterized iron-regulated membrane protein